MSKLLVLASIGLFILARLHLEAYLKGNATLGGTFYFMLAGFAIFYFALDAKHRGK